MTLAGFSVQPAYHPKRLHGRLVGWFVGQVLQHIDRMCMNHVVCDAIFLLQFQIKTSAEFLVKGKDQGQ